MATGQMRRVVSGGSAGFSMLDVLVAITVLTVGLLALGVLQAALTRNAADSLARSQVATFTEGLIERTRSGSYDGVASANIVPDGGAPKGTAARAAFDTQQAASVSNLRVTQTATTYYADAGGSFSTTVPATVSDSTPQYKKLDVVTTWTDASGTSRTLALNSIISPVTIKNDPTVFNQTLNPPNNSVQTPIVRQDSPVGPGVIPIATGAGNNTAATNPKPEISGTGKKTSPIAGTTSYNVLTYHNDSNNEAQIQRRVETLVVSCSCQFNTNLPSGIFAQPYRPTYWDGTRYVSPQATQSTLFPQSSATAPPNSGQDPGITVAQSPYCTECCRDHHDTADAKVKFDSFRTLPGAAGQPYTKYKYNTSTPPVLVPASASNDKYVNACRLIRVDGIFHTATDLQSSHMGLLATQGSPAASSPLPDPTYAGYYQNFVIDYLNSSFVSATPPAVSTVDADQKYASNGLNSPTSISITSAKSDVRYLHARGLYVDYLEAPAITAIQRACPANNLTSACVLPMLPFTTINTTELATWKSSDISPFSTLQVFSAPTCADPSGLTTGASDFPIQGCVAAGNNPAPSKTANAIATMSKSNSGMAIAQPVDPDDSVVRTNQQQFNVASTSPGGSVTASLAGLTLTNYTTSTYPLVAWKIGAVQQGCVNSSSVTPKNPNPYTCQPATLPGGVTIVVGAPPVGSPGGYNTTVIDSKTSKDPCDSKKKTNIQYCPIYKVDTTNILVNSVKVSPTVTIIGTSGALSEGSSIAFSNLNPSDKISVGFTQVSNNPATYTCVADPSPAITSTVRWNPCTP